MEYFERIRISLNYTSSASTSWILGKKHIFLSEGARQQLEIVRNERRISAATLLQSTWRAYTVRQKWPLIKQNLLLFARSKFPQTDRFELGPNYSQKLRPRPIIRTPPPFSGHYSKSIELCDFNLVKETCSMLGIDLVN